MLLQAKASFAEIRRCALCGATPGRVSARPLSSGRRRWAAATADPCAIGCSHMEPVPIFKFILLVLRVVQRRQKQLPEAKTWHPGRHTGRVEDRPASGPWQHPSGSAAAATGRPDSDDAATHLQLEVTSNTDSSSIYANLVHLFSCEELLEQRWMGQAVMKEALVRVSRPVNSI